MKPIPPGGVPLLDAVEAADLLEVTASRFESIRELGLLKPMDTPAGPRYRQDELEELRDVLPPAEMLRPGEAARILGVTVPTLRKLANEGGVYRDQFGWYDAVEIHALNRVRAGRKTLRVPEWVEKAS